MARNCKQCEHNKFREPSWCSARWADVFPARDGWDIDPEKIINDPEAECPLWARDPNAE